MGKGPICCLVIKAVSVIKSVLVHPGSTHSTSTLFFPSGEETGVEIQIWDKYCFQCYEAR